LFSDAYAILSSMIQGEQHGFTIIEVTLFLGISSLLLLSAFTFTNSTLRNMRFTDATKSLQNFVQEQYTRVQTNSLVLNSPAGLVPICASGGAISSSPGTANTGTSDSCILLGAALDIENSTTIVVSPVLGYARSAGKTLNTVNPQVWTAAEQTYTTAWQSEIVGLGGAVATSILVQNANAGMAIKTASVNRILILRNVESEAINFYATTQVSAISSVVGAPAPTSNTANVPILLCIKQEGSGNLRGAIQVKGTGTGINTSIDAISSSVVPFTQPMFTGLIPSYPVGIACGA